MKIQLPHDPTGEKGVNVKLPDVVTFIESKPTDIPVKLAAAPYAENFGQPDIHQQQQQQVQQQSIQQQQQQQPIQQQPIPQPIEQ